MTRVAVVSTQQQRKFARVDPSSIGTMVDAIKLHGRDHHRGHWDFDPRYLSMKRHFRSPRPVIVAVVEIGIGDAPDESLVDLS